MKLPRLSPKSGGFTLVELLIVVIILAILAAVAIPQFSSTTDEAKVGALNANLSALRSAIDLYKQQHGDYPGVKTAVGTGTAPSNGAFGTGAAGTVQALKDQLTMYTNADGAASTVADDTFKYGPYLKKGFPIEPVSNKGDIVLSTTGALTLKADTSPTEGPGGWKFDTKSGQIIANTVKYEAR